MSRTSLVPRLAGQIDPLPARRPRLLFLAYFFPPVKSIASVRSANIAKWLTRYGWEITVVTPNAGVWRRVEGDGELENRLVQEGSRCLRTPYRLRFLSPWYTSSPHEKAGWLLSRIGGRLAQLGKRVARRLKVPREIGWVREAERTCLRLSPDEVDVILATGCPFASFDLARRLARRWKRPYVLDYRDLWSGFPYPDPEWPEPKRKVESGLLSESAAATTVSNGMAEILRTRFQLDSKIHVVTNGYDAETLSRVQPLDFGHFAIVYTGRLHPPKMVVTPLMDALARLKQRGTISRPWMFHYYGRHGDHVRAEASRFGLLDRIVLHGVVPRQEALSAVRGAGMAVVISFVESSGTPAEKAVLTGKIFEAIGLKTPLLVIAPAGSDLEDVLRIVGLGRRFSGDAVEAMVSYLEEAMAGQTPPPGHPDLFDWARIGADLDRLLRGVLEQAPPPRSDSGQPGDRGGRSGHPLD